MSIWSRIADAIAALSSGQSLADVFDQLRSPPEHTIAFTIAVIGLGAKMAKADGLVTRDEVTAFREVFHINEDDEKGAARLFNLARTDVAGFEEYAKRIKVMYRDREGPLIELIEGLFHIAVADGEYHPNEDKFLVRVAQIFEINKQDFSKLRARFVPDAERDPYEVLGLSADATLQEAKSAWRAMVRASHPDQMIARGVPQEAIKLAEKRLIAINKAWEQISGDAV